MNASPWERSRSFSDILAPFDAKRIARAARVHTKTAERWRRNEATPSGEALVQMMASDNDLLVALLHAAGREDYALSAQRDALLASLAETLRVRR